jgi:formate dehydrogenase
MAKVLCVLYDDPVDGYPKSDARSVSGELGLPRFLEDAGHTLVVTSDKEGPDSVFERELADADVVISQPFWPAYLTKERIAKAKNLLRPGGMAVGSVAAGRIGLAVLKRLAPFDVKSRR